MAISSPNVQQGTSHSTMADITSAVNQGIANTTALVANFTNMITQRRMQESEQAFATLQNQRSRKNELFLTQAESYPGGVSTYLRDHYDQYVDWARSVYGWDDDTIKSIGQDISNQLLTPAQWIEMNRSIAARTGIPNSTVNVGKSSGASTMGVSMGGTAQAQPTQAPQPAGQPQTQVPSTQRPQEIQVNKFGGFGTPVDSALIQGQGTAAAQAAPIAPTPQTQGVAKQSLSSIVDLFRNFGSRIQEAATEETVPSSTGMVLPETVPQAVKNLVGGQSTDQIRTKNIFLQNQYSQSGMPGSAPTVQKDMQGNVVSDPTQWNDDQWAEWLAYQWGMENYPAEEYTIKTGDKTGYRSSRATEEAASRTDALIQFIKENGGTPATRDDFSRWQQQKGTVPIEPTRQEDASGAITSQGKPISTTTEGTVPGAGTISTRIDTGTSVGTDINGVIDSAQEGNFQRSNFYLNKLNSDLKKVKDGKRPTKTYDDISGQQAQENLARIQWLQTNDPETFRMYYPEEAQRQLELGKLDVANKLLDRELKVMDKKLEMGLPSEKLADAQARLAAAQAVMQERMLEAQQSADPDSAAMVQLAQTAVSMMENGTWSNFAEAAKDKGSSQSAIMDMYITALNFVYSPGTGLRLTRDDLDLLFGLISRSSYRSETVVAPQTSGLSSNALNLLQDLR